MIADFILDKSAFPHCFLVIRRPYLRGRPSFPSPGGRGKGEGPFPRHRGGTEQRSETGPGKTYGFQTFKMLQVALYHALGNLPESEFTHESF